MLIMSFIMMLIILFSIILIIMNFFIMFKINFSREKSSPFECGFDPFSSPRLPFSINFFLISIIFLIFDIEISIILPMIINYKYSQIFYWMFLNFIFMLILIFSLLIEWVDGSINWMF
uniref:NADH-ubiquinone oxidoreductase chain 3 n=1 Tax=Pristaulacus compressus TaxID=1414807 RepID=U5TU35_9HYME|nr:NADH dehydrogenase subunit 3 [Pristaulacus compressus]AGZ13117.1 NADH dehydrogenase subunit 3 [Pristaulacus compressus]